MSKTEKLFIIPDTHVPFHDERALALVKQVMKSWRPDRTIILGDFLDVYSLSRHRKDPALRHWNFKAEMDAGKREVRDIARLTGKLVYLEGNHEARLSNHISEKSPELYQYVQSVPDFLELDKLGALWVPYQEIYTLGKINYTHDTGTAGGNAHLDAEYAIAGSAVIGHTHRMAYGVVGNARGNAHLAAMFGWLGDQKYAKYISAAARRRYWSLGFGTGRLLSSGVTYLQPRPMIKYSVEVDGVIYNG